MREKLRSQHETVIALPKSWDSRRNRGTWQVWINISIWLYSNVGVRSCSDIPTRL